MMAAGVVLQHRPGTGGGTPLVFLHGVGSDAACWAPLFEALDPGIEALAWDAPGYGSSAPVAPLAPTPADYAARLGEVLDALQLNRVVLVGHSLGALFAARFAVDRPDRVFALALLSPALGYGVTPGAALPPAVQARIDDLARLGVEAFAEQRAPRLVHSMAALAGVRRAMAALHPAGYAQAVRALGAGTLLADAARLVVPTLVAVGAADVVAPPANARAVHAALCYPAAPLHIVPDAGHALPQEAPDTIARVLEVLAHG